MNYPENYRYTKQHQWVRLEGDTATVGITFHAQERLGDIVYVDLPKPGMRLESGKTLGSIESVKAVSDIYSPLSGEVTEINEALGDKPEKLNEDPHGAAWLIKLRVENAAELNSFLSAAEYQAYAAAENPKP
jgi:glycine cleavage system H protein